MRSILEVGSEQLYQKKGYNKNSMITKIDRELAEQIVNTIKDVCDHDINFIAPSGIILASTDSSVSEPFTRLDNRPLLPVLYWK